MLLRCALTLLMLIFLGVTANAAEEAADHGEHDFRNSIVVFTLEYEDDLLPAPPWALAEARIRRLGNVFFLTGIQPEGHPAAEVGEADKEDMIKDEYYDMGYRHAIELCVQAIKDIAFAGPTREQCIAALRALEEAH